VLYAFRAFYTPPPQPEAQSAETDPAPAPSNEPAKPQFPEIAQPQPQPQPRIPDGNISAEKQEEIVIDTPLYIATFWNVGGVLKGFRLKGYSDGQGQPVQLINQETGEKVGWPLAIASGDKTIDDALSAGQFAIQREADRLTLEFASNGIFAQKTIRFDFENYQFTLETKLTKDGQDVAHAVLWQGNFGDQSIPEAPARHQAVYQVDASFKRIALPSISDEQTFTTVRSGTEDQYFLAMFLTPDRPVTAKIGKQDYPGADGAMQPAVRLAVTVPSASPVRVYVGPKQSDWLRKADPQLSTILDYGYFEFIAKPLVSCLLWMHSYIGNFGWSIIILTVVINLVLFPLRLKQQASMLKMQKIQPHMRRLQDQYKKLKANDPRRAQVQSEMMGLYKEHGVNPMGGCLPLLLQMPLLFGFYSALAYSIELRRAPWMLWIKDLSQYDPYYVIPVLMAVAMIVQQKLTPTANMDPAQARIMMLMPIMLIFVFLRSSSGLGLYWLTGNVIGVVQQVFINKYWSPRAEAKHKGGTRSSEPRGA
jgi:YidC/Oxa1 family membrane protein insertase